MNKTLLVVILLAVVAVGAVMLMNRPKSDVTTTPGMDDTMPAMEIMEEGTTGASGTVEGMEAMGTSGPEAMTAATVKEFTLDTSEFAFDVKTITVKEGDTVKITLTNSGNMPHDWVVDEFSASTEQITKGDTTTVTFVANKAGTYEYYCSVGQHRKQGMVGKLVVE